MATVDELKKLVSFYAKTEINSQRYEMLKQMAISAGVSQEQLNDMIKNETELQYKNQNNNSEMTDNQNNNSSGFITDNQNNNSSGFITDNQNNNSSGFITDNQNNNSSGFITDNQNNNSSGFITDNQNNNSSGFISDNSTIENKEFTQVKKISSSGAMSEIFQALYLGRKKVIIKRIKPEYRNNKIYRDLFDKEFDNAFMLDHPNIVHISGKGEDSDGPYYYMEYIDGRTLADIIKNEKRKDENFIKKVFTEILDALSYVHKKQIFHRDLKPENIMVTFKGDNVKIIDFGLATADDFKDNLKQAGTPKYSAPEQLLNATSANQLSDIYSIGMIMIEMLGGEPDRRYLSKIENEFFRKIADRCTMSNPNDRFASCDEILQLINNKFSNNNKTTSVIPDWLAQKIKEYASDGVISKNERKMLDIEIEQNNLDKEIVDTYLKLELEKAYERRIQEEKIRRSTKNTYKENAQVIVLQSKPKTETPQKTKTYQSKKDDDNNNDILKKLFVSLLVIVAIVLGFKFLYQKPTPKSTYTTTSSSTINKGEKLYTTTRLNLRETASEQAKILNTYPKGTEVEVYDNQTYKTGDWVGVKVKKDGKRGYMSKEYLSKTK